MDHERRRGNPRKTGTTVTRHGHRGDLACGAARIVSAPCFLQDEKAMGHFVERMAVAGDAAYEGKSVREETSFVQDRIRRRAHRNS